MSCRALFPSEVPSSVLGPRFRLAGRPTFFACAKKARQRNTPRHTGLAALDFPCSGAAPRVVTKGRPWPIVPHLAFMPNAPLRHTCARPPDGGWFSSRTCSLISEKLLTARTPLPVRSESGIGEEGVERHGSRESCDGPWTAHRSGPLERRCGERTRHVAQRSAGPYVGGAFSLVTFSLHKQRESNSPCKAKQHASASFRVLCTYRVQTLTQAARGLVR